jgi:polysaccharide biosynthesis/export protein
MNIQRSFCLSIALACGVAGAVHAQQSQSPAPKPRSNSQASRPYLLGPGDVVEIKVFGQPELSSNAQVDSDGNLSSLPFLDAIPARCRSEKEVQKDIALAYRRWVNEPQVSVRTIERNSRTPASISGAIRQSTKVPMLRKQRLSEVVAAAGGFTERAAGTIQILHTEPVLCPESSDEVESMPIDGTSIPFQVIKIAELRKGVSNPLIRPGDLILVTEAEPIYLTGSVVSPGSIMMREDLTLSRAIGMVGGTRKEANLSEIRIHRQKPGSLDQEIIKVDYAAIKRNQIPDVFLKPYDIIDVSETGLFSGSRWLATVIDALTGGLRNTLIRPM